MRKIVPLLVCVLLPMTVFGQTTLNGAGATFPYPIYSKWFAEYHKVHPDVEINYQSIGSGGGIRQVTEATVEFGASDMPMTDAQLKEAETKLKTKVFNFPTVLGAVVPAYNIPGVTGEIKFTPEVLAGIFLGKIANWNDKAIASDNPGVKFPNQEIIVVHRSDGSGTTFIWTVDRINSPSRIAVRSDRRRSAFCASTVPSQSAPVQDRRRSARKAALSSAK